MVLRAVTVLPIVSTLMSRGGLSGGPAIEAGAAAGAGSGPCPLGGTASSMSMEADRVWQASNCKFPAYGGTLTVNGTISSTDDRDPPTVRWDVNVVGTYQNSGGETVLMGMADFGGVSSGPVPGGTCQTRGLSVQADEGHIRATTPDGRWAEIGFVNTMLGFGVSANGSDAHCVPITYGVGMTGPATVSSSAGGFADVTFTQFNVSANDSTSVTKITALFGGIASDCIGGSMQIIQPMQAELGWSSICPTAGEMVADFGNDVRSYLTYGPNGVDFDIGFNSTIDVSAADCLDQRFLECE
jgi:hypothetical protein